jgi:hypothetical protein
VRNLLSGRCVASAAARLLLDTPRGVQLSTGRDPRPSRKRPARSRSCSWSSRGR